jgi:hypothetical protein
MPLFQPCPERKELLDKAMSALREHNEFKRKADTLIGTDEYQEVNQSAWAALHKAKTAFTDYLHHVLKHGC